MTMELEEKKRVVALVFLAVFVVMFSIAWGVARNRRIDDFIHARDAAPLGSNVAPVAS
ncbi:MAG TPA: hypothetical protein VFF73_20290 [Planctomycetota bacterium]|nr:hypothetical protein [Planctomycetota bacterium]